MYEEWSTTRKRERERVTFPKLQKIKEGVQIPFALNSKMNTILLPNAISSIGYWTRALIETRLLSLYRTRAGDIYTVQIQSQIVTVIGKRCSDLVRRRNSGRKINARGRDVQMKRRWDVYDIVWNMHCPWRTRYLYSTSCQ